MAAPTPRESIQRILPSTGVSPAPATASPLNVKWFGAKGDGVTDDYAALQAALSYALANGLSVYIPAGHYKISARLDCANQRICIQGAGRGVTLLDWHGATVTAGLRLYSTSLSNSNRLAGSSLSGFDVNVPAGFIGIELSETYRITVREICVIGAGTIGIWCKAAFSSTFDNVKVGTGDYISSYAPGVSVDAGTVNIPQIGWKLDKGVINPAGTSISIFLNCSVNWVSRQGWLLDDYASGNVWLGGEVSTCGWEAPGYYGFHLSGANSNLNVLIGTLFENNGLEVNWATNSSTDLLCTTSHNQFINIRSCYGFRLANGSSNCRVQGGSISKLTIDAGATHNYVGGVLLNIIPAGGLVDNGSFTTRFSNYNADGATFYSEWRSVTFDAANFASDVGTWSPAVGGIATYQYKLDGNTMTLNFDVQQNTTTGTPGYLKLKVPGGYTIGKSIIVFLRVFDGTNGRSGVIFAVAGETYLRLYYNEAWAAWPNIVADGTISGQITFEI